MVNVVQEALAVNAYRNNLRGVGVKSEANRIILFGEVKTYFLKQIAQSVAMRVLADETLLVNQIFVDYGSQQ
jgi:hypothetical protein